MAKHYSEESAADVDDSELIYRIQGDTHSPPVVYLPGVHGDWTPQASATPLLSQSLRLVQIEYPKMSQWRVEDYVQALVRLLDRLEFRTVHLVAESFGSLVGWQFGLEYPERVRSMVIIGGFAQPPEPRMVRMARWGLSLLPADLFERGVNAYVMFRRRQGRLTHPETEVDLPYPAVRTELGRAATIRRFDIISQSYYLHDLHDIRFPVRYIGGELDLIVPVKREIATLERLLSEEADFKSHLIPGAPHMIIASHPEETSAQVTKWILEVPLPPAGNETDRPTAAL